MRTRTATAALMAVAALGIGACGDANSGDPIAELATNGAAATTTPAVTETATTATTATTTTPAASKGSGKTIKQLVIFKNLKKKPVIEQPSGAPPTKLYSRDIVKGKGKAAKSTDKVTVQYVGVSYSTGEQFDASWDNGSPFSFQLGKGAVIKGWDEGVPGMKVGGRRLLVIPPDLAYGDQANGKIAANETLVFVIDLKKIN
jgi:peptidylprolyl isomerase